MRKKCYHENSPRCIMPCLTKSLQGLIWELSEYYDNLFMPLISACSTWISYHHYCYDPHLFRCCYDFKCVIAKCIVMTSFRKISSIIAFKWTVQDPTDHESTLAQVITWCCQATTHYLSQCWPRSMSPHDISRPQWVNSLLLFAYWSWARK